MSTIKALVWHGPRDMRVETVPMPVAGPGEVLVQVDAVGICGSELSGFLGENSLRKPPLIMGHEFSGRIAACPDGSRLQVGDRVAVNPLSSCGNCRYCQSGLQNLCRSRALVGVHRPGAFAEYVVVPEQSCHVLPAHVSPVLAALAEPLACSVRAAELAEISPGESVLVIGAGAIGLFALTAAREAGANVRAITDTNAARLATADAWGATHLLDARADLSAQVLEFTDGHGVDVAIDAVGATVTRQAAIKSVRPGGRVVFLGLHEAESVVPANDMVRAEVRVTGSFAYRDETFAKALALLERGAVSTEGPWLETRGLADGPDSFAELVSGAVSASKIMLQV